VKRLHKGVTELDVLRDLMLGGRHSRSTAVRLGISFPTADRWRLAHQLIQDRPDRAGGLVVVWGGVPEGTRLGGALAAGGAVKHWSPPMGVP
jgi:hypothetical protein